MTTEISETNGAEAAGEEQASDEERAPTIRVLRAPEALARDIQVLAASREVRVVRRRVVDSLEQADIDIERAGAAAAAIVEEARREAASLRAEARKAGREEGLNEVLEHVARARTEYAAVMEEAEKDMLELAFRLARRIIGEAIELEPARVQQMLASVLRHARGKREISVCVAPADLEMLEAAEGQFSQLVDGVPVIFEADRELDRGSCVIRTESGRIDGRIETQLETLERALAGG